MEQHSPGGAGGFACLHLALAAAMLSLALPAAAQEPPTTGPALRSDATEVLVDVLVVANTPLTGVPPGQYQFRATLMHGKTGVRKSIYVNIE